MERIQLDDSDVAEPPKLDILSISNLLEIDPEFLSNARVGIMKISSRALTYIIYCLLMDGFIKGDVLTYNFQNLTLVELKMMFSKLDCYGSGYGQVCSADVRAALFYLKGVGMVNLETISFEEVNIFPQRESLLRVFQKSDLVDKTKEKSNNQEL